MGYKSHAQRKAVQASKAEQKKKSPATKKEDFPEVPEAKKGKFTNWVKKNMPGSSTCDAASKIMKSKKKYKPAVIKMANYANNFGCKK